MKYHITGRFVGEFQEDIEAASWEDAITRANIIIADVQSRLGPYRPPAESYNPLSVKIDDAEPTSGGFGRRLILEPRDMTRD